MEDIVQRRVQTLIRMMRKTWSALTSRYRATPLDEPLTWHMNDLIEEAAIIEKSYPRVFPEDIEEMVTLFCHEQDTVETDADSIWEYIRLTTERR